MTRRRWWRLRRLRRWIVRYALSSSVIALYRIAAYGPTGEIV